MRYCARRPRKITTEKKTKMHLLPSSLRGAYRRLQQVNNNLLTNHYWEQRTYITAINMQYAIKAIPVLPGEKIRIHFLHVSAGLWPVWDSLYQSCMADERLEVKVIFLDTGKSPLAKTFPPDAVFLREKNISYTPYENYDPYAECPHILVYQSHLDSLYLHFAKLKANFIKKHGTRPVCLCGPEYDIREPDASKILYQQYAHMFSWRIVAASQEIKEDFYRSCLPGGDSVLVVEDMDGKMILDRLLKDLLEEQERLSQMRGNMSLGNELACLARLMPEER